MKNQIIIICWAMLLPNFSKAQDYRDSLDIALASAFKQTQLPGISCIIASKDSILYKNGFGLANKDKQLPFTPATIQSIGSISKTILAVSVMQLIEEGKLTLETSINDILPFPIVHPSFPDIPISIKHLVTHTSGIQDSYWDAARAKVMIEKFDLKKMSFPEEYYQHAKVYNKNKYVPMDVFLKRLLYRKGKWYDAEKCFTSNRPGSKYHYSNVGAALTGYIIEIISGKSYNQYVKERILNPLGMNKAFWSFGEAYPEEHAMGYFDNGAEVPPSYYLLYPAGSLRCSADELSLYLMEMLKGYQGEGILLKPKSYETMFTVQFAGGDNPGVFWDISENSINHNGGSQGNYNLLLINKKNKLGKILMTNTNAHWFDHLEGQFLSIWRIMTKYQEKL